jgi:hypothetical protein
MAGRSVTVLSTRLWPIVSVAGGTRIATLITYDVDGQAVHAITLDKERPTTDEVQRAIAADIQYRQSHAGKQFTV